MVYISPLRGLIYNREKISSISKVVSPPYDVISEKRRKDLLSFSQNNIINLILPDGQGNLKYANASSMLQAWIDDQILIYDDSECFYGLEVCYKSSEGVRSLKGFIGLTRIEEYGSGIVLRHEKTLPAPKEDRYRLLDSCRTNFGLIYTIYKENEEVQQILGSNFSQSPFISTRPCYDEDLLFNLWKIAGPDDIDKIRSAMAGVPILIADGHHRYETSLMYKKNHQEGPCKEGPEDYVLTLFMDSGQKEMKIYPTYRRIKFKADLSIKGILSFLGERYDIKPISVKNGSDAD